MLEGLFEQAEQLDLEFVQQCGLWYKMAERDTDTPGIRGLYYQIGEAHKSLRGVATRWKIALSDELFGKFVTEDARIRAVEATADEELLELMESYRKWLLIHQSEIFPESPDEPCPELDSYKGLMRAWYFLHGTWDRPGIAMKFEAYIKASNSPGKVEFSQLKAQGEELEALIAEKLKDQSLPPRLRTWLIGVGCVLEQRGQHLELLFSDRNLSFAAD